MLAVVEGNSSYNIKIFNLDNNEVLYSQCADDGNWPINDPKALKFTDNGFLVVFFDEGSTSLTILDTKVDADSIFNSTINREFSEENETNITEMEVLPGNRILLGFVGGEIQIYSIENDLILKQDIQPKTEEIALFSIYIAPVNSITTNPVPAVGNQIIGASNKTDPSVSLVAVGYVDGSFILLTLSNLNLPPVFSFPEVQSTQTNPNNNEVNPQNNTRSVTSILFLPDITLVVGYSTGVIEIFDKQNWAYCSQKIHKNAVTHLKYTKSLENSSLGNYLLISAYEDLLIKLWDIGKKRELAIFEGHSLKITCLTVKKDGNTIVSSSLDKTMRAWNIKEKRTDLIFEGHSN